MISSSKSVVETRAINSICDYVTKNGFNNLLRNKDNTFCAVNTEILDNKYKRFSFDDRDSMLEFADLLGRFHYYAEGFVQPPGSRVKTRWGKLGEKYKKMTLIVKDFVRELEKKDFENNEQQKLYEKGKELLPLAEKVVNELNSNDYFYALEHSMQRREICINRIYGNTAVRTPSGIFITSLNEVGYNLAIEDIIKLINKIPKDWDKTIIQKEIISVYYDVREIDTLSLKVLNSLLLFPYDIFKMIISYIKQNENKIAQI